MGAHQHLPLLVNLQLGWARRAAPGLSAVPCTQICPLQNPGGVSGYLVTQACSIRKVDHTLNCADEPRLSVLGGSVFPRGMA